MDRKRIPRVTPKVHGSEEDHGAKRRDPANPSADDEHLIDNYSPALFRNPSQQGRGNGIVRQLEVQSLQRAYGNRITRSLLNRQPPSSRSSVPSSASSRELPIQRQPNMLSGERAVRVDPNIAAEAKADVDQRHWRLPELERDLLARHWSSTEERRLYTRYFLIEHYRYYTGEELDSDALSLQMVHYEQLYRNAYPEAASGQTHSSAGSTGWLDDAMKTPEERAQERDETVRAGTQYAQWEMEQEAAEKAKEEKHERTQLQMINMPPSPNAYRGVEIYFLAEDSLPRNLEAGKRVQMEGAPELPPEQRVGVEADEILHVDRYDLWPTVIGEPGKPTLHHFTAINREQQRAEYIVGPEYIDTFVANLDNYKTKANIYYMFADKGAQPSPDVVEKIRMSDAVFQKGDFGTALWHWGRMWTQAVRSPRWWISFGLSGLMAGTVGGPAAVPDEMEGELADQMGMEAADPALEESAADAVDAEAADEAEQDSMADQNQMPARRGCFVAGTTVLTEKGPEPIESLPVGGYVRTFDPITGNSSLEAIERTHERTVPTVLDITLGTLVITCSPEHPFWVAGRGWQKAGELGTGTPLLTGWGRIVPVDLIWAREGSFKVYNIEVAGPHTYLVSSLGILVHNKAMEASKKSILKSAELPTTGRLRYVPPKRWTPSQGLPRGPQNGYIDRFGNEWVRGPSRTAGEAFEWDVQLSNTGKSKIGWLSRDPDQAHVNVSLGGEVTH